MTIAYSQLLDRYFAVKEQLDTPTSIPLLEESSTETSPIVDNDKSLSNYIDVTLFPEPFENRVLHLLNHIRKQHDMNDRGDLLIEGEPIVGTHKRSDPLWIVPFFQGLQKSNIP